MTTDPPFDPTAPLAGAPEPWESAPTPSRRSGPPYHMTDMIAAEPALAGRILDRLADAEGPAATLAAPSGRRSRRRPGHRDRLRDVRARGARGRRDPARSGGRRPACRTPRSGRSRPSSSRWRRRPVVSSSASPTKAGRPPPTRRSRRRDGRREDRRHHGQPPLTGGRAGHDRGRDRGARPRLVSHRRLSQPDPGRCRGRRAPVGSRHRRATASAALADGTRDETGADGDRGGPRRCGAAPRRRVRVRTAPPAASSSSRSRRRRGCRRPTATSRRSSTATCPRPDRRQGSSWC